MAYRITQYGKTHQNCKRQAQNSVAVYSSANRPGNTWRQQKQTPAWQWMAADQTAVFVFSLFRLDGFGFGPWGFVRCAADFFVGADADVVLLFAFELFDFFGCGLVALDGDGFFVFGEAAVGGQLDLVAGDPGCGHLSGLLLPFDGDGFFSAFHGPERCALRDDLEVDGSLTDVVVLEFDLDPVLTHVLPAGCIGGCVVGGLDGLVAVLDCDGWLLVFAVIGQGGLGQGHLWRDLLREDLEREHDGIAVGTASSDDQLCVPGIHVAAS